MIMVRFHYIALEVEALLSPTKPLSTTGADKLVNVTVKQQTQGYFRQFLKLTISLI